MGQATYPFKFINKFKHVLLRYDGIAFIFENPSANPKIQPFYMNKCKLYEI